MLPNRYPKFFKFRYTVTVWLVFLSLGLYPKLSFAGAAPLTAVVTPTQSTSADPLGISRGSSQIIEAREVKGDVRVQRQGSDQFENIQNGAVLHIGETLRTGEGSCHLVIDGKNNLFLGPRTVMKINEASRNDRDKTNSTELSLTSGKLKVLLEKLKKGSTFEVTTPTAIAAVRGTVLYMNVGDLLGQLSTQLYVDETHGGVFFKNTITGQSFLVPAFSLSSSFSDGKLNEPQHLSPEQKDAFVKNWEGPGSNLSQQFGIEEIPNPASGADNAVEDLGLPDENAGPLGGDAKQDKISDRNIAGANGFTQSSPEPSPLSSESPSPEMSPSPEPSASPSTEPSPTPVVEPSPTPSAEPSPTPSTEPSPTPSTEPSPAPSSEPSPNPSPSDQGGPGIDVQEQQMIRQEIGRILYDGDFDQADAKLAQISDAQTGKVFTDVFGNRVRVDQYIFHPADTNVVSLLSLTARTGEDQKGVSALLFSTVFNRPFDSGIDLKSLPWNDYMNVVRKEDVAVNLRIAQNTPEYDNLYGEYIIHEHRPELTQGDENTALYPVGFAAIFANPARDRGGSDSILFLDSFSAPFSLDLEEGSVVAQGKIGELLAILPFEGQAVERFSGYQLGETITIGEGAAEPFIDISDHGNGGSQTAAFVANFNPSKLRDINSYRNLAVNNDGDPNNDEHPAYFDDWFNQRLGLDNETVIGRNHLIGGFIPINNEGQVIDQPGFKPRGLRDILSPNPLVNGGNYNLEVILMYGYVDGEDNSPTDIFHEDFRIDTIITPEIFQPYGIGQGGSSLFPPALYADDDDTPQNQNTI